MAYDARPRKDSPYLARSYAARAYVARLRRALTPRAYAALTRRLACACKALRAIRDEASQPET
jgi:hypothetical protein